MLRERLLRLLHTLSVGGDLPPSRLSTVLRLAAELPQTVTAAGPHLAGSCGGALLVLLAAAQGERLGVSRAVKAVQAAGTPASSKGINTSLTRLREHWRVGGSSAAACTAVHVLLPAPMRLVMLVIVACICSSAVLGRWLPLAETSLGCLLAGPAVHMGPGLGCDAF